MQQLPPPNVRGTVLLTIKNVKRKQRKCEVVKPDPKVTIDKRSEGKSRKMEI
jgi:hypothetical protein